MKLSKIDISKMQIERAIDLFVNESDYVSAITLAAAAEEIMAVLLSDNAQTSASESLYPWFQHKTKPANQKDDARKITSFSIDALKDTHQNTDDKIDITPVLAAQMLQRALVNYPRVVGKPTDKMIAFVKWFNTNEASVFEPISENN
ncbi:MAG: hypothetical protein HRU20_12940 [Pseudomonadales bacterium]|nr:hypothetical protein [Pseudomonadales bacterium]